MEFSYAPHQELFQPTLKQTRKGNIANKRDSSMKNRAPLLTVLLGSIIFLNAAPTADAQPKDKAEIRQWLD
jgi:hypothetical protein